MNALLCSLKHPADMTFVLTCYLSPPRPSEKTTSEQCCCPIQDMKDFKRFSHAKCFHDLKQATAAPGGECPSFYNTEVVSCLTALEEAAHAADNDNNLLPVLAKVKTTCCRRLPKGLCPTSEYG
ncbi:hypothetical protein VTP01DRAFT_511 [Rhizomucor pusillus]|uniref:uncharacterized protein n=1 Tax=Rhizomucor pusillus TaxID=4840 RepID=UPI003741F519